MSNNHFKEPPSIQENQKVSPKSSKEDSLKAIFSNSQEGLFKEDLKILFVPESPWLKGVGFVVNFILIIGLLFVPNSALPLNEPLWMKHLDKILTVIFSIPLTWQFLRLFKRTGITVTSEFISENLVHKSLQIPWRNIQGFGFIRILFLKYLLIFIHNPEGYIQSLPPLRKIHSQFLYKKFKTPIRIPIHLFSKKPKEISDLLYGYYNNNIKPQS